MRNGSPLVWRVAVAALMATAVAGVSTASAAISGSLVQLRGTAGCVTASGKGGCARARAVAEPYDLEISPDGRHAYVASVKDNAIAAFRRSRATGRLTQLSGRRGCIRHRRRQGCATGRALADPWQVRVSPDGRNVYAVSRTSHVVTIFKRSSRTGALSQLRGAAGCLSQFGGSGCGRARAIAGAAAVRVSDDGRHVYVASVGSDAVAVFERDRGSGALSQLPGAGGCVSQAGGGGCAAGRGLDGAIDVALSGDGRNVYVASWKSGGVAVFARDQDGSLTQLPGTAGCINGSGADGCGDGRSLAGPLSVFVSPDAAHVYAASISSIAAFRRDSASGALAQPAGRAGCVSETAPGCARVRSADDVTWITQSPDGRHLYMASFGRLTIGVFRRAAGSGELQELSGRAGCLGPVSVFGCAKARAVRNILALTVSPDGRNLYTASTGSDGVAVFRRAR